MITIDDEIIHLSNMQLYCRSCPFELEPASACKPICPDCGAELYIRTVKHEEKKEDETV
jgi:predicted RNA-binding Zn-ribbon protein involved in translation (DUF1610 family)